MCVSAPSENVPHVGLLWCTTRQKQAPENSNLSTDSGGSQKLRFLCFLFLMFSKLQRSHKTSVLVHLCSFYYFKNFLLYKADILRESNEERASVNPQICFSSPRSQMTESALSTITAIQQGGIEQLFVRMVDMISVDNALACTLSATHVP